MIIELGDIQHVVVTFQPPRRRLLRIQWTWRCPAARRPPSTAGPLGPPSRPSPGCVTAPPSYPRATILSSSRAVRSSSCGQCRIRGVRTADCTAAGQRTGMVRCRAGRLGSLSLVSIHFFNSAVFLSFLYSVGPSSTLSRPLFPPFLFLSWIYFSMDIRIALSRLISNFYACLVF